MADVQADDKPRRSTFLWWILSVPAFYLFSFVLAVVVMSWHDSAGLRSPRLEAALTQIFFPIIWLIEKYHLADFLRELFRFLLP